MSGKCSQCGTGWGDRHKCWCGMTKPFMPDPYSHPKPVATVLGVTIYIDPSLSENVVQIGNQRFTFKEKK